MTKAIAFLNHLGALRAKPAIHFIPVQKRGQLWEWVSYGLIALSLMALAMYLFGANSYAAAGYEIGQAQKSIQQLTEENKKLTLKVTEQSSIAAVQAGLERSQFVPISGAKFLEVKYYTQK